MNVLITGANGFLGSHITKKFSADSNFNVVAVARKPLDYRADNEYLIPELDGKTNWEGALSHIDTVIHCAACATLRTGTELDSNSYYQKVNVDAARNLAFQAATAGVKRFLFISSVKVHGEFSQPGIPFKSDDKPAPVDAYGQSKLDAEIELRKIADRYKMELVIIRPPLIYGRGAKGNFASFLRLASLGIPLPFGAIKNVRSFVSLENIESLIRVCLQHPAAADQVFLVSDGDDISTGELFRQIAKTLKRRSILVPVPRLVLYSLIRVVLGEKVAQKLLENLQVDITHTKNTLNWSPPVSFRHSLNMYFGEASEH